MKFIIVGGALLVSAVALAGCGEGGSGSTSNNAAAANAAAPASEQEDPSTGNAEGGEEKEGAAEATPAGAQQDFTLVNNTGRTLMTLNVSQSDSNEWGPDILGTATVADGASGTVQFARGQDQCSWDIRATFEDGQTGDWRGVNLCETTTITLTPTD